MKGEESRDFIYHSHTSTFGNENCFLTARLDQGRSEGGEAGGRPGR